MDRNQRRSWRPGSRPALAAILLLFLARSGAGSERAGGEAPHPAPTEALEVEPSYFSLLRSSLTPPVAPQADPRIPTIAARHGGGGGQPETGTPSHADGEWRQLLPPGLGGHTALLDPHRRRMIVFGGADLFTYRNDVLALPLDGDSQWERFEVSGPGPVPRAGHVSVYDSRRHRLIVFAGANGELDIPGTTLGDLWELSLGGVPQWRSINANGPGPSPRQSAFGIYDSVRDRVLVLGGLRSDGSWNDELWELRLGGRPTWRLLHPSGDLPAPDYFSSVVYDEVNDQMILLSRRWSIDFWVGDVFSLALQGPPVWRRLQPAGSPPLAKYFARAIYDAVEQRMLIYGGWLPNGNPSREVWSLTLGTNPTWSRLNVGGALPSISGSSVLLDPTRRRVIAYGGLLRSEVWVMKLETPEWTRFEGSRESPPIRVGCAAFYDPVRDRVVTYGTLSYAAGTLWYQGTPWELRLGSSPAWTPLQTPGDPELHLHRPWAFDPAEDRLLVFGDRDRDLHTIWQLNLGEPASWTPLFVVGDAPRLVWPTTWTFDPVLRRAFVFGLGESRQETWSLDVAGECRWTNLTPAQAPPPGINRTAFLDPIRRRFLMFGGYLQNGLERTSAVWSLDLDQPSEWRILPTGGIPPSGRAASCGVYDPTGDRLLLFGGGSGGGPLGDLWELSLRDPPIWKPLTPWGTAPIPRYLASAVYDSRRGRMVLLGGSGGSTIHDTWFLEWHRWSRHGTSAGLAARPGPLDDRLQEDHHSGTAHGAVPYPDASGLPMLTFAPPRAASNGGAGRLTLVLRAESDVRLSVWDLQGRVLRSEFLGHRAAGTHMFDWRPTDRAGTPLQNGLYFVGLETDRARAVTRILVVR